ncbi:MAG: hypothetical protein A2Y64_08365 [Candidatus Coatesbacteria bacterium RBG_13_66_14]|uniref:Uncharacterized protein n=1 Tax=Candidatus Coatesbacteria bacterium RBG_13_66_14 TaxID=1817816 RepID=A0A1F5EWT2_9BACT|nr:MAG: hypothetical protein A2Y64_08365 [Candidatus Coatesbacteria bacterium RBG_13_66_14]
MTLPETLMSVGAGALALAHLVYPLLCASLSIFAKKVDVPRRPAPTPGVSRLRYEGIEPESRAEAPILVSPGRGGRLTDGGVRRLVAPLDDERTALVVGRLLAPEVEESGRTGGREAALAQAESIHRGWTWRLAAWEAGSGVPSDLDGHPYAVRREFADGGGVDLSALANAHKKAVFLPGKRGLVGRLVPPKNMAELTARVIAEKRRGIRSIPRRRFSPRVLVRHLLGNLTALWLALLTVGSVLGMIGEGGWFYRVPLALTVVFLLGAAIGRTVFNLGFRSRVYFPLWWLFQGLVAEVKAWLAPGREPTG